jgi:hypothetical protein
VIGLNDDLFGGTPEAPEVSASFYSAASPVMNELGFYCLSQPPLPLHPAHKDCGAIELVLPHEVKLDHLAWGQPFCSLSLSQCPYVSPQQRRLNADAVFSCRSLRKRVRNFSFARSSCVRKRMQRVNRGFGVARLE